MSILSHRVGFFILGKLLGFPPQPLSHSSPLQSYTPACSHKDSKSILYLSLFCLLFLSQQPCLPLRRIVDLWRKISINYYQICKRVWSCLWERGLLQTFHAERWSMMGSMQGLNGSCMKWISIGFEHWYNWLMCILYSFPNTSSELLIWIRLQKNVFVLVFHTMDLDSLHLLLFPNVGFQSKREML